jgi:hypothetical protein
MSERGAQPRLTVKHLQGGVQKEMLFWEVLESSDTSNVPLLAM